MHHDIRTYTTAQHEQARLKAAALAQIDEIRAAIESNSQTMRHDPENFAVAGSMGAMLDRLLYVTEGMAR